MRQALVALGILAWTVACSSASGSNPSPTPSVPATAAAKALLVFTTWVPDPNVTNGPEPGYRPALSGLTGHDVQSASAVLDMTGTSWVIDISFTPDGARLFAKLTGDNVAACPDGTCAERHLGIWLDLTQSGIDRWGDPSYVAKVSQLFDLGCLAQKANTTECPKLVSDPITLQEITGGHLQLGGNFTQQSANQLANAINSGRSA